MISTPVNSKRVIAVKSLCIPKKTIEKHNQSTLYRIVLLFAMKFIIFL